MAGMPSGMMELLQQKYGLLGQQADADTLRAKGSAALDMARASTNGLAVQSAADLAKAQANSTNVEAGLMPGFYAARNALMGNQGFAARAEGQYTGARTVGENQMNSVDLNTRLRLMYGGAFGVQPPTATDVDPVKTPGLVSTDPKPIKAPTTPQYSSSSAMPNSGWQPNGFGSQVRRSTGAGMAGIYEVR